MNHHNLKKHNIITHLGGIEYYSQLYNFIQPFDKISIKSIISEYYMHLSKWRGYIIDEQKNRQIRLLQVWRDNNYPNGFDINIHIYQDIDSYYSKNSDQTCNGINNVIHVYPGMTIFQLRKEAHSKLQVGYDNGTHMVFKYKQNVLLKEIN